MELGPVKVFPTLKLRGEPTDNLFLEPGLRTLDQGGTVVTSNHQRDDFLTTLSPGLLLKLPIRHRHFFQLQYQSDLLSYLRYHKHNTTDHHVGASLELDFPGGLDVNLAHRLNNASTPPDFETVRTHLDSNGRVIGRSRGDDRRADYLYNVSTAQAAYAFGNRYKASLGYTHQDQGFAWKADRGDDFKQDEVWANFSYRILPKTSVLFEPALSHRDNTDKNGPSTDDLNLRLWVGLQWDPTAKLNGTFKGGYIRKTFDESDGGKDSDTLGFFMDLTYHLSQKTLLGLNGYRQILGTTNRRGTPSPQGGAPVTPVTDVTIPVPPEERERGNQIIFGSQYVATEVALSLRHQFAHKFAGQAAVSFHTNRYKEAGEIGKKRKDDRLGGRIGLEYQIQEWLLLGLGYSFVDANSNIETEEYDENRFLAQFQLAF